MRRDARMYLLETRTICQPPNPPILPGGYLLPQ
jgi:hypothetical protein